jgi:hypothetical protein
MNNILSGDILVKGYNGYLDGLVRPGKYHYAGIYVGDGLVCYMTSDGVEVIDIIDFCRCDRIIVLRMEDINDKFEIIDRVLRRCNQFIDITNRYVCQFSNISHRIYSPELIDMCWLELELSRTNTKILCEDIINNKSFKIIYGNEVRL